MDELITKIREGKIDINNQELFFSTLIKGLMLRLDDDISIRGIAVPHLIIHTGSDSLYLERKGYDQSLEPQQISNEDYIYNVIPRCIVSPGGIELVADQLTNPYSLGQFQYEGDEEILNLVAEFRRMPVKLSVDLKYLTDSYRDMLELTQQILTKLSFIRTFHITYMGQSIQCSYRIPDSFSGEYVTELDGTTTESKNKTMSVSLEVETNLPVISQKTVMSADKVMTDFSYSPKLQK